MTHRVFSWISVFLLAVALVFAASMPVAYSIPFFGFSLACAFRAISLRQHKAAMRHASYILTIVSALCLVWTFGI